MNKKNWYDKRYIMVCKSIYDKQYAIIKICGGVIFVMLKKFLYRLIYIHYHVYIDKKKV